MNLSHNHHRYLLVNNVIAGQTPHVVKVLEKVIPKFDRVIEIGTGRGAFSFWISQTKREDADFYTYDISGDRFEFQDAKLNFTVADCFESDAIAAIQTLIQEPSKRVLLMCDGGNKEREMNVFSKFLKPNDVAMCHDYSESALDYNKHKAEHQWPTNSESHLKNLELAGMSKFEEHYHELKNVFWGAFVKN